MPIKDVTPTEGYFIAGYTRLLSHRDLDARRGPVRAVREAARILANDLGVADLNAMQQQLVMRAAVLSVLCTHNEAAMLLGQAVSLSDYIAMTNTQRRLLATLNPGLKRVPRDVMTLTEYLAQQQPDEAAE